jgi:hypothetical protein
LSIITVLPLGISLSSLFLKPVFKKRAVCRLAVAFYGRVFPIAQSANGIYPVKFLSPRCFLDNFPTRRVGIFALQIDICAAFVNINAFVFGNSFEPFGKLSPLLL